MRRLTPRQTRFALLCALVGVGLAIADVSPTFALSVVPVLGLVAALIAGAFPGERLIERLRERRSMPRPRRAILRAVRPRPAAYVRPVGRAAAFALAMRPPPAVA
ncbi:hypothetical protein [Baekduia sp. Peel2402]|uniref:hypothetical protein n=1 Tax=Baekduia sp. Peel2402 TaxID=3458296 RepID=UPI00403EAC71